MKKIVVIGGGTMGLDIAQVFAKKGFDVVVRDIKDEIIKASEARLNKGLDKLVAKGKMDEAKKAAAAQIDEIQNQIRACLLALDRIKEANRPVNGATAFDYDRTEGTTDTTEAVANEISMNLEALVGTTDEPAPKVAPNHPTSDTTSKFANLQFGRNYDPTHK